MNKLTDKFRRVHDYLRISLTDKCNLQCLYCIPSQNQIEKFQHKNILTYEELTRLIHIFVKYFSVNKIRFTGGEPLVRKNILSFFEQVHEIKKSNHFEIGITTNGTLLEDKIESLHSFGMNRLNISLDSLQRNKFIAIAGKDLFDTTLRSINKALKFDFDKVKLNAVIIKNINDDELIHFIDQFHNTNLNIRFIEYMPFSGNGWDDAKFISWGEMKSIIETKYHLKEIESDGNVAKDFLVDGTNLKVSFISSISNHFCYSCNRLRITSSGKIKNCLFAQSEEINLKSMLADYSFGDELIAEMISNSLQNKWFKHPSTDELAKLNHNIMMSIGG